MDEGDFPASVATPGQAESRTARVALDGWLAEQGEPPAWVALWRELSAERVERAGRQVRRWDWRKALYIAWSSVPKSQREPKTLEELARLLGLGNTGTIRHWRAKDPGIEERIATLPRELLLGHVADVYQALVAVASSADARAHQDRRLFLELVGQYSPKGLSVSASAEAVAGVVDLGRFEEALARAYGDDEDGESAAAGAADRGTGGL